MEPEINEGYVITVRSTVGKVDYVLGIRDKDGPGKYVTWAARSGTSDYYWGHYFNDRPSAEKDLAKRVKNEISFQRQIRNTIER